MPKAVWSSTSLMNMSSTWLAWSRETLLRLAMAVPRRCTSFGPMYFRTCAASPSPRVISSSAARSVPDISEGTLLIAGHPFLDDLRDSCRIMARYVFRCRDLLIEGRAFDRGTVALRHGHARRHQDAAVRDELAR